MDKESTYQLQLIDCNCNDCFYMQRDIAKYQQVVRQDKADQLLFFRNKKARAIRKARSHKDPLKRKAALEMAVAMKHTYIPQTAAINYGRCDLLKKEVSFIPNTLQIETQGCFRHRRSNV